MKKILIGTALAGMIVGTFASLSIASATTTAATITIAKINA